VVSASKTADWRRILHRDDIKDDNLTSNSLDIDPIGYSELAGQKAIHRLSTNSPHTQVWPDPLNFEAIVPATAVGISASSKTIRGAFLYDQLKFML
jgi:hypothetical protein